MADIKKNIVLNLLNTITGVLFPVITFPYAARVLMPEGIGIINFQNSIINYIVILTSLGIPLYAVREIARCRNNIHDRTKTLTEILILSAVLTLLGYVIVFLLLFFIPKLQEHAAVFLILSLSIIFTAIGVQWFYQAIEDFKYITVRAIVIRSIAVISLFIFVHSPADLVAYAFITVGSTVGNNFINIIHLRKYVKFTNIKMCNLNIVRHLRPSAKIFVLNVITSLYGYLNTTLLGFMSSEEAVGYYTAGFRISSIVLSAITSIGYVMLPRLSYLYNNGDSETFTKLAIKNYRFLMLFSVPCVVGLIFLANPIIHLFCGSSYDPSIIILQISAPIMMFKAFSNLIGVQILYPQGKEKIVIFSCFCAAIINIILNVLLIPLLDATGVAVSTLLAEMIVMVIQVWIGRKYIKIKFWTREIALYFLASALMIIPIILIKDFCSNIYLCLLMSIIFSSLTYGIILYYKRDVMVMEILKFIKIRN